MKNKERKKLKGGLSLTFDMDEKISLNDGQLKIFLVKNRGKQATLRFVGPKEIKIQREVISDDDYKKQESEYEHSARMHDRAREANRSREAKRNSRRIIGNFYNRSKGSN